MNSTTTITQQIKFEFLPPEGYEDLSKEEQKKEYNRQYNKFHYEQNKEKLKAKHKEYKKNNKESTNKSQKKWKEKNKDKVKGYQKGYQAEYKEKNKEKLKEYQQKNKEKLKEYRKENKKRRNNNDRKRYQGDPAYKIQRLLRDRLYKTIKSIHLSQKSDTYNEYLDCTLEELKIHIESQFTEGQTWDNHGQFGWHLDHIRPLSSFDLENEDELKACCHYTNLQPLWWQENLQKSDKY